MATPTVIGINFGGSASSVAVISKVRQVCFIRCTRLGLTCIDCPLQEGLPDCIANDDGERQISNAVSYGGEEEVALELSNKLQQLSDCTVAVHWHTRKIPAGKK